MVYGLLLILFIIMCFSLILLVLVQKGKGGMGLGTMGGSTQMLFGGSGGQDLFQKITWVLGALFMTGSLALGLMKSSYFHGSRYFQAKKAHQEIKNIETSEALPESDMHEEPAPA